MPERGRGPSRAAVFIERDGVLTPTRAPLRGPDDLVLAPGVLGALQRLRLAGLSIVVLSHEPGIARGITEPAGYRAVTEALRRTLRAAGVPLAGAYCCPHDAVEGVGRFRMDCACRAPRPGLLLAAARDLGIGLAHSFAVTASVPMLEAGRAAGVRESLLVGVGLSDPAQPQAPLPGLAHAADAIVAAAARPLPSFPPAPMRREGSDPPSRA